ncbi:phospholipid carrier-dependent glycosyltransferase [Leucobacter sp. CX87]|uniref:phospholipid carrier-dependent glycosyltransferase n=1 Tax=unclassified Leucobacter TaxID=2621730 RepID=UPI00333FEC4C
MPALTRTLRRVPGWVWPVAVLALAAALRLIDLGRPGTLVFDELYYVRDAVSQLTHGYPTTWPDDDPAFGGERSRSFMDAPGLAVHPPLGKWLIGLGMLALGGGDPLGAGIDSGWGWRIAAAIAGILTVALTMRIAQLLTESLATATLAGLFLAIDGVHVVLSRVSLLDGFLTLLVTAGVLCMVHDHQSLSASWRRGGRWVQWRRPWLLAAGVVFGLAAGVKWSGMFALAAFLLLTVVRDALVRARLHPVGRAPRPVLGATLQTLVTGAIALPAAAAAYLATWLGWILTPGGWARQDGSNWFVALWQFHVETITWHETLSAPHPYRSDPWTWPLGLRPTAMYSEELPGGLISVISPIPNPIVTWAGVAALITLAVLVVRAAIRALRPREGSGPWPRWQALTASPLLAAATFALVGYLSGWLPWVLTVSRSAVFQFYAVVLTPFSALALALALAAWVAPRVGRSPEDLRGRRIAAGILVGAALAAAAFFFPLWTGMPIDRGYWQLHLWLPGWR